jgi:hypothetical protein
LHANLSAVPPIFNNRLITSVHNRYLIVDLSTNLRDPIVQIQREFQRDQRVSTRSISPERKNSKVNLLRFISINLLNFHSFTS